MFVCIIYVCVLRMKENFYVAAFVDAIPRRFYMLQY